MVGCSSIQVFLYSSIYVCLSKQIQNNHDSGRFLKHPLLIHENTNTCTFVRNLTSSHLSDLVMPSLLVKCFKRLRPRPMDESNPGAMKGKKMENKRAHYWLVFAKKYVYIHIHFHVCIHYTTCMHISVYVYYVHMCIHRFMNTCYIRI